MRKSTSPEVKKEVDEFNQDEVGIKVRYWPGKRIGAGKVSRTNRPARAVDNKAVVWVEGHTGCIHLHRVKKIK